MDGHEFISLAGKLAASANAGEAAYRTAVSRAYYGAFHAAMNVSDVRVHFGLLGVSARRPHQSFSARGSKT